MRASEDLFRRSYAFTLRRYVREETENLLHAAYELGREAVVSGLTVLEVAQVHHSALASALRDAEGPEDTAAITERAGQVLLESLAAFEMVKRGFSEAQEAAAQERRQARVVRRLSALLADASLALGGDGSLDEMLRVVAEQARELTAAHRCRVHLSVRQPSVITAAADDGSWDEDGGAAWTGLRPVAPLEELDRPATTVDRLAEPLTTLGGARLGVIELDGVPGRRFRELDRAILRHVAQMASAAVERLGMHRGRGPTPD
jgi:Phosphoserine phosphatase RsbU, N-terminal domain